MNSKKHDQVMIDTSVLLEDPQVLGRIIKNGGIPFLSNTILDELEFNKSNKNDNSGDKQINKNARFLFREFIIECNVVDAMPNGQPLLDGDKLTRLQFKGNPVYSLHRKQHVTKINNDSKIIEVAADYGFIVITRDNALQVRARTCGVNAQIWTGPTALHENHQQSNQPRRAGLTPFETCLKPISVEPLPTSVSPLPGKNDIVNNGKGQSVTLLDEISRGGEGVIYATSAPHIVCKVYHKECVTQLRRQKIELMLTRRIDRHGICWPIDLSLNENGDFVGYLMPRAEGRTIQSTMFVKPILEKTFPKWTRIDLVKVCRAFLNHIEFLHGLNIIVGDINPMNLLVNEDSTQLWVVDTDSFQIGHFPCPVATINFTAPEIQGIEKLDSLRTIDQELFAVATMLFMILHPGKPPYSQQGGGSPADNIRAMDFPYGFRGETSSQNAPQGPWFRIWNNLPFKVKECFHSTFRENHRVSVNDWIRVIYGYGTALEMGHNVNELFPTKLKILDGVSVTCTKCNKIEDVSRTRIENLQSRGKPFLCTPCVDQIRLKNLARRGQEATERAMNGGPESSTQPKPKYAYSATPTRTRAADVGALKFQQLLNETTRKNGSSTQTRSTAKKIESITSSAGSVVEVAKNVGSLALKVAGSVAAIIFTFKGL